MVSFELLDTLKKKHIYWRLMNGTIQYFLRTVPIKPFLDGSISDGSKTVQMVQVSDGLICTVRDT